MMSDEEDNLDDLFGAFDGEEKEDEVKKEEEEESENIDDTAIIPKPKKQKESTGDVEAVEAVGADGVESTVNDDSRRKSETGISSDTNECNLIHSSEHDEVHTTSSSTSNDELTRNQPQDQQQQQEQEREIATGTSHDKSIRTFTAYPDPKALQSLEEQSSSSSSASQTIDYSSLPPAKTYPFKLDPFQQQSTEYISKNQSVLVAAHTSAGKTVVAEYAIAQSLTHNQRVIYTSPIKALSNQKYRDLSEEFGQDNVGLMTGDITINPSAICLVMTTEILRSMLYRGSELMREVAWVIYDEVHYMRDKERGVVWEESIILLPHKVRFVFLSATIPNAKQFVQWIAKIHHQICHVVYTNYRPTPLQHYIFAAGSDGLNLVVDEKGKFREKNFQRAMASLQGSSGGMDSAIADAIGQSGGRKGGGGGGRNNKRKRGSSGGGGKNGHTDLHRIVKLVMERNLNPVIIFSFSKKDCERYALELNKEDYTDEVEKDLISQVYKNAIESLSEDDRLLPQVEALLPLLKRGIGIHHGGLLPILKEIVEILFSEGLIKALFATETFAIGINMPAKTVVFTNTRKWDGKDFRWISSGEYIQMSGRAGRRGKDDRGIVIQMIDEKMEPSVCKGILYGDPDPLNSSYRISYNMLLNLLRVEDVDPEYLLRASFHQFQQESEAPALENQANDLEKQALSIVVGDGTKDLESKVREYHQMKEQLLVMQRKMKKILRKPQYATPFLQSSGRVLKCSIDDDDYGWGVLISYKQKSGKGSAGSAGMMASLSSGPEHTLEVLLQCVDRHFDDKTINEATKEEDISNVGLLWRGSHRHCRPFKEGVDSDRIVSFRVFTIGLDNIDDFSAVRLFTPKDIQPEPARRNLALSIKEVQKRFPEGIPLLDPVKDMKVKSDDYKKLVEREEALKERLASHSLSADYKEDERQKIVGSYGEKANLLEQSRVIRNEARSCQGMVMRDDLKKMKRVLRQLGHVDANGVIQTKGRTACEINTANELVVVELMFIGVFNDLSVEQCMALLSCLTFDDRVSDDDPTQGLKSYLSNPFYKLQECARTVAKAMIACKIELDEDEFVDKINPGL
jgi:ATP-dependent RNA helicase DOB1